MISRNLRHNYLPKTQKRTRERAPLQRLVAANFADELQRQDTSNTRLHGVSMDASNCWACRAASGVSPCLKYTNTSPRRARSATFTATSRRALGEYLSFRRRRYKKSAVWTSR